MMELVGVASGIILLYSLGKCGRVYADNQGIVKQLTDYRRIRRTGLMGGSPLSPSLGYSAGRSPPLAQGQPGTT